MVHGIGIELMDIARFKKAVDRGGKRLLTRLFTENELGYCLAQRFPERHFAARFAAKVSLFKALGKRLSFRSIEITRDGNGTPSAVVSGLEGFRFSISITHDGNLSIAETIAERL